MHDDTIQRILNVNDFEKIKAILKERLLNEKYRYEKERNLSDLLKERRFKRSAALNILDDEALNFLVYLIDSFKRDIDHLGEMVNSLMVNKDYAEILFEENRAIRKRLDDLERTR